MKRCVFDEAWIGSCGNPCHEDNEYCPKHAGMSCIGCRKQARRTCEVTMGPMICGQPLCESCTHNVSGSHGAPWSSEKTQAVTALESVEHAISKAIRNLEKERDAIRQQIKSVKES